MFDFQDICSVFKKYQATHSSAKVLYGSQGADPCACSCSDVCVCAAMESISSKVLIWTVVEALVLIGVAVWQVVYISKFFEVKRMI